jgi:hypothetical protein
MMKGAAIGIAALIGGGLLLWAGSGKAESKGGRPGKKRRNGGGGGPLPVQSDDYPPDVNDALGVAADAEQSDCPEEEEEAGATLFLWQTAWQVLHDFNQTDAADDNTIAAEASLAVAIVACKPYPEDVQAAVTFAAEGGSDNLLEVQHHWTVLSAFNQTTDATEETKEAQASLGELEARLIEAAGKDDPDPGPTPAQKRAWYRGAMESAYADGDYAMVGNLAADARSEGFEAEYEYGMGLLGYS